MAAIEVSAVIPNALGRLNGAIHSRVIVRHSALPDRAEMEGLRCWLVAAGGLKLRAA